MTEGLAKESTRMIWMPPTCSRKIIRSQGGTALSLHIISAIRTRIG
jgi:hypothetical protein